MVPATVSLELGSVVPMPTLPFCRNVTTSFPAVDSVWRWRNFPA